MKKLKIEKLLSPIKKLDLTCYSLEDLQNLQDALNDIMIEIDRAKEKSDYLQALKELNSKYNVDKEITKQMMDMVD